MSRCDEMEDMLIGELDYFDHRYPRRCRKMLLSMGYVDPINCVVIPMPKTRNKKKKRQIMRQSLEDWLENNA